MVAHGNHPTSFVYSNGEDKRINDTEPKPLTAGKVFWAVFLALWAFAITAGILGELWSILKTFVVR